MRGSLGIGIDNLLTNISQGVPGIALGPELVTNGTFGADTNWTKGAGVTISGGTANFNSAAVVGLFQNAGITIGKVYRLTFDIVGYTSGQMQVWPGGTSAATTINIPTANGSYSYDMDLTAEVGANGNLIFGDLSIGNTYVMSLDNVSLKELL